MIKRWTRFRFYEWMNARELQREGKKRGKNRSSAIASAVNFKCAFFKDVQKI